MPDMRTKTIQFTERAVYRTIEPVTFEKGTVHEFREDIANRWISRGVAVEAPLVEAKQEEAPSASEGAQDAPASPQRRRHRGGE